jgi:septal ring factor EnvC (AmiA/AmiB activator)
MEDFMQPEILDTPQDENHSDPSSAPAMTQAPSAVEPAPTSVTPTVEKKRSRFSLAVIALIVCSFLLIAGLAWVGYWAYQLSVDLTATQQQLSTLQTEHEELQADYAALTGENAKLTEDLTKAQSELTASQAELTKSKDENQKLNAKVKKANELAGILNGFFHLEEFSSFVDLDKQIEAVHDSQLTELWDDFAASPDENSLGEFLVYLVPTIQDALK